MEYTDGTTTLSIDVRVVLEPVDEDTPSFTNIDITVDIDEDTPVGTLIATQQASDDDNDIESHVLHGKIHLRVLALKYMQTSFVPMKFLFKLSDGL